MSAIEHNQALKRKAILDAARELIKSSSIEKMTMRALAKKAQVGHVTPYSLFGSKDKVLIELLREPLDEEILNLLLKAQSEEETPIEIFFHLPAKVKEVYEPEEEDYGQLFKALMKPDDNTERQEFMAAARTLAPVLLKTAVDDGQLRADTNVVLVSDQILLTSLAYLMMWANKDISADEYIYQVFYTITLSLQPYATAKLQPLLDRKMKEFEQEFTRLYALRQQALTH